MLAIGKLWPSFIALSLLVQSRPELQSRYDTLSSHPTATLACGPVIGTTSTVSTPTVAIAAVTQYLGIPFAAPPQRFSPPEPVAECGRAINAQTYKPICVQQFGIALNALGREQQLFDNPGYPRLPESEDCLYANVFVPPGTKPGDGKAVMFWVFGGSLAFGGSSLHFYDGSSFAYNQDVIVVTHNYRTNVFGFPGSPQLKAGQENLGFLDQRLALQWTQENIEKFGGDPAKVTIFGQSAGGFSVRALVGLPPRPLPFRAAILQSEAGITSDFVLHTNKTSEQSSWEQLALAVGCVDSFTQLECMRSKPASQLKAVSQTADIAFFPVEDGSTYVADIRPAIAAGNAARVPLIIGNTANEANFIPYCLGLNDNETTVDSVLSRLLPNRPALADTLAAALRGESVSKAIATAATDAVFLCPASQLAHAAQASGYDVWQYRFSPAFPNQSPFPNAGAYHTTDIPEIFGTYALHNALGPATPQQIAVSKYMQTAWANFAKHPVIGPGEQWPQLGSAGNVNDIGRGSSNVGTIVSASSVDPAFCAVLDALVGQQPL